MSDSMRANEEAVPAPRVDSRVAPARVPLAERAAWTASLEALPHAFGHTWESCYAMSRSSGAPTFLYRVSSPRSRLVCPLAERSWEGYRDLVTPYGFSGLTGEGDLDEGLAGLATFARRHGYVCGYLLSHPALPTPPSVETVPATRHAYLVDLQAGDDELFARLDANRRRQVSAFERSGETLVWDRGPLQRFFLSRFPRMMREKGAAPVYRFSPETLACLVNAEGVLLVGAGRPDISAMSIFAYTPFAADYLFTVSVDDGRRYSAILVWHAMLRLRALGVPVLNLGGGIREGDGVAAFKERFGARRVALRAIHQIYRPGVFADLCDRAGVDANASGYFPPYRALDALPRGS